MWDSVDIRRKASDLGQLLNGTYQSAQFNSYIIVQINQCPHVFKNVLKQLMSLRENYSLDADGIHQGTVACKHERNFVVS